MRGLRSQEQEPRVSVSGMGELECPEVPVSQKAIKTRFYKNERKKKHNNKTTNHK